MKALYILEISSIMGDQENGMMGMLFTILGVVFAAGQLASSS